jgi:hypothetical protein
MILVSQSLVARLIVENSRSKRRKVASPDVVVFDAERHGEEILAALRAFIEELNDDFPAFSSSELK